MIRAKAWFDKLTTLSKIEGQSTPSSEKDQVDYFALLAPWRDMLGFLELLKA